MCTAFGTTQDVYVGIMKPETQLQRIKENLKSTLNFMVYLKITYISFRNKCLQGFLLHTFVQTGPWKFEIERKRWEFEK